MSHTITRTASALVFVTGLAGVAIASSPAGATTTDTTATVDSSVSSAQPGTNFGSSSTLTVDGRTNRTQQAFLKFTVPDVAAGETLDSVTLRLRPTVDSSTGVTVVRAGNGWTEGNVTWSSRPSTTVRLGTSGALAAGTVESIALDASKLTPGEVLSVRIETSARKALTFSSSEARTASSRPELRVSTASRPTPTPTPTPTPNPTSFPPATPVMPKVIGMSAPTNLWAQRIQEVGAQGVTARRIFADLSASGSSQLPLIRETIADGMMPVISYKVPDPAALANGSYDTWLSTLRSQLTGLGAPVTATFWHEPNGDMDPAVFRAASLKFFNLVDAPSIAVGPILNGWLLDRRVSDFAAFTDATLLNKWEFVAVDSYQNGTAAAPGDLLPARAVPLLASWMDSVGHPNKPLGLGEYNGHTAQAVAEAGESILSTPELWFGLAWNSTAGAYSPLVGDRITAFQRTKADPRARR
ncbi:DNRLRE domain-containing protein [Nocardioides okcheonensis]|uniref:DNRLRE domain-containing protein n=1 Tax=Nocardioides okcheonensis TaxID=2894081 RepID=UPI001E4A6424|nr:DNRLRE domain-containing protein [Nocardioides okcheonensis]UFN45974.1 DNRLRE domain-containing protein [Nocardioides okcheonensis]